MHKIKIRLPATVTNLGPELYSLGLALSLYTTVDISERTDDALVVEVRGEGSGQVQTGLRHPVVLALMRMFQRAERAPLGITVHIDNAIPLGSGLGAESAFTVAGVIGANNLLGGLYTRPEILAIASGIARQMSDGGLFPHQNGILASVLGGMTTSTLENDPLVFRSLAIEPIQVIVALPDLPDYTGETPMLERVPLADVLHNISRVPLLMTALAEGDLDLLAKVLHDRVRLPLLKSEIPGYDDVVEAAMAAGAKAVTLSGDGPAVLAFAETKHDAIAEAMVETFGDFDIDARTWVLPIDTQGLVLSVMQSA